MIVDFLALNDVSTSLADAYVLHFFAARCYASAAYAVSVCVSVCPFVDSVDTNKRINE